MTAPCPARPRNCGRGFIRSQPQGKFKPAGTPIIAKPSGGELRLKAGDTEARVAPATGQLLGVKVAGKDISLTSGAIIRMRSGRCWISGWLKLDYSVDPAADTKLVGVAYDYPEEKMLKKTWPGDGPYSVRRNRLKGQTLGVWETKYNTTETGYTDWIYPEFAGWFANVRWLKLATTENTPRSADPRKEQVRARRHRRNFRRPT